MENKLNTRERKNYLYLSSLNRGTEDPKTNMYVINFKEITNVCSISIEKVYLPKTPGLLSRGVIFLHLDKGATPTHFHSIDFNNRLTFPLFIEDLTTSDFYVGKCCFKSGIDLQYKRDFREFDISFTDNLGNLIDFGEADNSVVDLEQNYITLCIKNHPKEY